MMQPVYINHIASIHPGKSAGEGPGLSACEPDYKAIITNPTLRRRMSRIIKMGVACGLECIASVPPEEINAIITATGLGCLTDTEKFLNAIIDSQERMLNPTPFIQSTFNTIGAQIALLCRIQAYNMTYVHRGLSFESALLDAMMRIAEGDNQVLVGAVDEITPASHIIQRRLGLLKGSQAGEGAHFFLLGKQPDNATSPTLCGVETFIGVHSAQDISERIIRFLQRNECTPADIDCFINGRNGNPVQDAIYETLEKQLFAGTEQDTFKDQCGEYQTASAYAVWKAAKALSEQTGRAKVILIYNHYQTVNHSLILLKNNNR